MKRSNFSMTVYLALVFLSGAAVGSVGYGLYNAKSVSASLKANPCTAENARRRYMDEMQARLKLTPAQVKQFSGILEDTHHRFHALRDKYRPEVQTIEDEQTARVRAILTESQRAEYEKIRRERGTQPPKK